MIRLGILTCTKYKKSDLASQTATTGQVGLQSHSLCSHVQGEFDIAILLVLAGCTPILQTQVKMLGHERLAWVFLGYLIKSNSLPWQASE